MPTLPGEANTDQSNINQKLVIHHPNRVQTPFVRPKTMGDRTNGWTEPFGPLMTVMSMNEAIAAAKNMPPMLRLMGTLLLRNTLNIWGGDNGVGKSIGAFTVAEHLARGWKVLGM